MAVWGVNTWDDSGRLTMGPDVRAGLFKGFFNVLGGAASGSFTDASMAGKSIFYIIQTNAQEYYERTDVTVDQSLGRFSWSGPVPAGFTVYYGAF